MSDYSATGGTPLNKTIIAAFASGSYRNEKQRKVFSRMVLTPNRVANQSFAIVITDGDNTLWEEFCLWQQD